MMKIIPNKESNHSIKAIMAKMLFLFTTLCFLNIANGQSDELQVTVQIKITELGIRNLEHRTDPVFKFFIGTRMNYRILLG